MWGKKYCDSNPVSHGVIRQREKRLNTINDVNFLTPGHKFKGYHGHFPSQYSLSQNTRQRANERNLSAQRCTLHHHHECVGYSFK
jgi:hypothetical protein